MGSMWNSQTDAPGQVNSMLIEVKELPSSQVFDFIHASVLQKVQCQKMLTRQPAGLEILFFHDS